MNPVLLVVLGLVVFAGMFGGLMLLARALSAVPAEGPPLVERREETTERQNSLGARLKQAGIAMTPVAFQRRAMLVAATLGLSGAVIGQMSAGGIAFGAAMAAIAYRGKDWYIRFKHQERLTNFVDQLADALAVMANGVRSGQTVVQTFETLVNDFADPMSVEVEEVLQELRMGVPLDDALDRWVKRMPGEDLEIAATALAIQRQTGGNVAEILSTVATTIRERAKLAKQIHSLTAQGRMTGWVLSLLPVGMFVAMSLIAPGRMALMLTNPIGIALTALGVLMIATGGYFIRKIVSIEV